MSCKHPARLNTTSYSCRRQSPCFLGTRCPLDRCFGFPVTKYPDLPIWLFRNWVPGIIFPSDTVCQTRSKLCLSLHFVFDMNPSPVSTCFAAKRTATYCLFYFVFAAHVKTSCVTVAFAVLRRSCETKYRRCSERVTKITASRGLSLYREERRLTTDTMQGRSVKWVD